MIAKKIVLYMGAVGTVLLLTLFYRPVSDWLYDYCFSADHCPNFLSSIDFVGHFLLLTPPLFLLSLITYKMRDEVFRAWWNFARWWVPAIILVTFLQSMQSGGAGPLGMHDDFNRLLLGFFYAVLVLVSLWRIVGKYRQMRREGK